jgi:hypothetical protein
MSPETIETTNTKTQSEEQEAPRPWSTPTFERVPLNEALNSQAGFFDGTGFSS